jgi:AAA domain
MGRLLLNGEDPFQSLSIDSDEDLSKLRDQIQREEVPLVVIDSLRSAHGGEENSSQKVGEVMNKLAHLAQETGVAILVVHHTKKLFEGQDVDHNSARGSNAVIALARSMIALSKPDRNDDAIRVEVVKSNVAKRPRALGFRITETGIVRCPAPYPKKAEKPPSQLVSAKTFLQELLAGGTKKSKDVEAAAKAAGIAEKTLQRAKQELGVISDKQGNGWIWKPPPKQLGQKKAGQKK